MDINISLIWMHPHSTSSERRPSTLDIARSKIHSFPEASGLNDLRGTRAEIEVQMRNSCGARDLSIGNTCLRQMSAILCQSGS
jgi:hypothetical protein